MRYDASSTDRRTESEGFTPKKSDHYLLKGTRRALYVHIVLAYVIVLWCRNQWTIRLHDSVQVILAKSSPHWRRPTWTSKDKYPVT